MSVSGAVSMHTTASSLSGTISAWLASLGNLRTLSWNDAIYGPQGYTLEKGAGFLRANIELFLVLNLLYLPICELCKYLAPYPNYNPKKPQEATAGARAFHAFMDCVCMLWNTGLAVFSTVGAFFYWRFMWVGMVEQGCTLTALFSDQCADGAGGMMTYLNDATLSWWSIVFILSKVVEFGDTWLYCFQKGKDHLFLHWCVYPFFFRLLKNSAIYTPCCQHFSHPPPACRSASARRWHHQVTGVVAFNKVLSVGRFCFVPVILNMTVHSVMYSYYALMALQKSAILPKVVNSAIAAVCSATAIFITGIQITQMAIALAAYPFFAVIEPEKGFDMLSFTMYAVYLVYFANLFVGKYITRTHKAEPKPEPKAVTAAPAKAANKNE